MSDERVREVLGRVTAGELTVESDEVKQLVEESPELRERIDVAAAAGRALERAADWHRDVQREAEEAPTSIQEARIAELVREHAERRRTEAPPPTAARRAWIAAAAVVLVLIGWAIGRSGGGGDEPGLRSGEVLGSAVPIVAPSDGSEVERYDRFEWRYESAPGREFEVHVWAVGPNGEPSGDVDSVTDLLNPTWTPEPGETDAWPDEIIWQVHVTEFGSVVVVSDFARVRRSSP